MAGYAFGSNPRYGLVQMLVSYGDERYQELLFAIGHAVYPWHAKPGSGTP